MSSYRWAVTVRRTDAMAAASARPFVRQVNTEGPNPDCAAKKALDLIQEDTPDNGIWHANELTIKVERVQ